MFISFLIQFFFLSLSKNSIIDITNLKRGSQIDLLGGFPVERALFKYKHENLFKPYPLNAPFKFENVSFSFEGEIPVNTIFHVLP